MGNTRDLIIKVNSVMNTSFVNSLTSKDVSLLDDYHFGAHDLTS